MRVTDFSRTHFPRHPTCINLLWKLCLQKCLPLLKTLFIRVPFHLTKYYITRHKETRALRFLPTVWRNLKALVCIDLLGGLWERFMSGCPCNSFLFGRKYINLFILRWTWPLFRERHPKESPMKETLEDVQHNAPTTVNLNIFTTKTPIRWHHYW